MGVPISLSFCRSHWAKGYTPGKQSDFVGFWSVSQITCSLLLSFFCVVCMVGCCFFFCLKGGDGTLEEMCLSFFAYYPATNLSICVSQPSLESYRPFVNEYIE